MDDFIGFQFNGVHSSELGILRVSEGDRYNDTIIPTFQDKTAVITGGDGTLYWDSFYTQKPIPVSIAFDHLTEFQYRRLSQVFNGNDTGKLIFDERPYKYYMAKLQSAPQIKSICFMEGGERIYKGEGTLQFICYFPYARSIHKFLDEYNSNAYINKTEWAAASRLKSTKGTYDGAGSSKILYNAGDKPANFKLYVAFSGSTSVVAAGSIKINGAGELNFRDIPAQDSDTYICFDSSTNLIEGCVKENGQYVRTGNLYNEYITSGDFFKIPAPLDYGDISMSAPDGSEIVYDYIYY